LRAAEHVRRGYEAFNRRDIPAMVAGLDSGIEYRMPMDPARRHPVFRGPDGVREFYEIVFREFELFHADIASIREFDDVVVAMGRFRTRPRGGSEDEEQSVAFAHFWTVRDGRAIQASFHDSANPFSLLESRGRRAPA
jgi:ketosteroid isomerase-like protein